MRQYFNASITEIESAINRLNPKSIAYAEYLDELRHRSTKRARVLLDACSHRRVQAQAHASQIAKTNSADDFAVRLKGLLHQIEIDNDRLVEVMNSFAQRRAESSSTRPDWVEQYRNLKEQESRRLAEESESERQKNSEFWSEFEETQKRELAIRDRLLALDTDQLMELFDCEEWDSAEEERILKAVLRQRVLA